MVDAAGEGIDQWRRRRRPTLFVPPSSSGEQRRWREVPIRKNRSEMGTGHPLSADRLVGGQRILMRGRY